jgi:hypothetical protein
MKTMQESAEELHEALHGLFLSICEVLHFTQLADWLIKGEKK